MAFEDSQNSPPTEDSAPVQGSGVGTIDPYLKLAQDAYSRSTNYFETNYRKGWEDNLRMFQSKHPKDSKYQSDAYKYRSRIFRPKSRSVLRKNEATAALAFFSNPDVVSVDPQNEDSPEQVASSVVMKELLQYRLTKTIPWFLTAIGGFQDAMSVGLVASLQCWRYRAKTTNRVVTAEHPEFGPLTMNIPETKILEDRPSIDLFPIENIRFDPAAHWYDVVATSPYVILQIPMYVNDVLDNMESENQEGKSWRKLSKAVILAARVKGLDPLRQARNDNREDAETVTSAVNEFDVVMVHLNFIKTGDTTYAYYTLEDKHILSDPMPVEDMFLHCKDGRPPVQIGFCVIETHKPVPTSLIGLGSELQKETNEIANQRLDNVKFVLNKRWMIRRGANVDVDSLLRNVPGGITMVNDVEKDAREVNWQDVTSSSYQEQDRVNVDMDELMGNFAQGSVMTNRKLNETVGGMRIMAQGANALTEYTIQTFVETWVEPVLRQLIKMEQAYETDEVVLAIAAQKAQLYQQFGMSQVTDSLLNHELTLSVNVGMGATDPDTRLQRFMQSLGLYNQIAREGSPDIDLPETRKQIFGLAGFKDSARFFKKVDPRIVQAQQAVQQAEGQAQAIVQKAKDSLNARERQLDQREVKMELDMMAQTRQFGMDVRAMLNDFKLEAADQQFKHSLKAQDHEQKMLLNRDKAEQKIEISYDKAHTDKTIKVFEANLNAMLSKFEAHTKAVIDAATADRESTLVEGKDGSMKSVSRVVKH